MPIIKHNNNTHITHITMSADTTCEKVWESILNFINNHPDKGEEKLWFEFGTSRTLQELDELALDLDVLTFEHERVSTIRVGSFAHSDTQRVLEVVMCLS